MIGAVIPFPLAGCIRISGTGISGFTALGIWQFNKWRAWLEIIALLDAQWQDGMIPHIVFRHNDPDYFPGPDVWSTNTEPPTSGHSQPPVLSSIIWQIVQQGTDYDARKAREVFPKLMAYHRWFCAARDPQETGVISIVHPWESGRDNCPDWDIGMDNIVVPDNLESIRAAIQPISIASSARHTLNMTGSSPL